MTNADITIILRAYKATTNKGNTMGRKQRISERIRFEVIQRDNGRCRACGIGDIDALQADHIIPESKGGKTTLNNLQALCGVCNNRKQNTVVGHLPILPAIEGFGDKSEVMSNRDHFQQMLEEARQAEVDNCKEQAIKSRENGQRLVIILNRIAREHNVKFAERIRQEMEV